LEQHKQRIILKVWDCMSGIRLITEESAQTGCISVCLNVKHSNTLVFSKCRLLAFWLAHWLSHFNGLSAGRPEGFGLILREGHVQTGRGLRDLGFSEQS